MSLTKYKNTRFPDENASVYYVKPNYQTKPFVTNFVYHSIEMGSTIIAFDCSSNGIAPLENKF